jgi:hypothetical protein
MKHILKTFYTTALLLAFFTLLQPLRADAPGPPPGNHGGGGNVPGGGAPIDDGLYILLIAGAAYGARKLYQVRGTTSDTE